MPSSTDSRIIWKVLLGIGLAGLSLPVLLFAYQGTFSRYMADDFSTAATLHSMGFIPMQIYWYTHWSGRFVFYFFIAIAGALDNGIVPFLPALLLLALVYETGQIFSTIFRYFHAPYPVLGGGALGLLIVGAAFSRTPTIVQSLYWQTGSFTYTLPFVFFFANLILFCRQYCQDGQSKKRAILLSAVCFLLAILSAGLSESFLGVQLGVLTTLIAAAWLFRTSSGWQKIFPLILSAWLGTAIAAGLVVLAPGNAYRQATLPAHAGIPYAVKSALIYTATYLRYTITNYAAYGVLLFVLPAAAAYFFLKVPPASLSTRMLTLGFVSVPVLGFALWVSANVPSFYAMWSPPSDRVIIIHHFIFCFTIVILGLIAGVAIQRSQHNRPTPLDIQIGLAWVIALFIWLGPIQSGVRISKQTPVMQQFAQEWDARHKILVQARQEKQKSTVVPRIINISELDDLGPDPKNFWNRSVADYYHLPSIRAE